jgi:hypothetical protein
MLVNAGVKILLHAMVVYVIMDGKTAKGTIVELKSRRQALLAKSVMPQEMQKLLYGLVVNLLKEMKTAGQWLLHCPMLFHK